MLRRRALTAALSASLLGVLAACSSVVPEPTTAASAPPTPGPSTTPASGPVAGSEDPADYAVTPPGPLKERLLTPDVLIESAETIPQEVVDRVAAVEGIAAVLPISLAASSVEGKTLRVAAVDPAEFRRFTRLESARAPEVWKRLAGGEVVVDPLVSRKLINEGDMLQLGSAGQSPSIHVGAFAPLVRRQGDKPSIQVVVNDKRGEQLGIPRHNALLVSTGQWTPSALTKRIKPILGRTAALGILALEFKNAVQVAVLTGASVSEAVGTFTYTNLSEGRIQPDARWENGYIRYEAVPILGMVRCNKAMLPQLRAALSEIVQRGLASEIHPDEYAGCYYPRYIGRDPSNGLSLHSWGIAVDLNVPGNLRGTKGEMDRTVVKIFKKWGFAWGGDWNYTDPMHFEMARVVQVG